MTEPPDSSGANPDSVRAADRFGPRAHGIAAWPFQRAASVLPAHPLPGRSWPRLRVLTLVEGDSDELAATRASVAAQGYPNLRHDLISRIDGTASLAAIVSDEGCDGLILLRPGDLLAPDALAALALQRVLSGADLIVGLRVVFDTAPFGLDAPAAAPGRLVDPDPPDGSLAPFTGGEVLLARACVQRAAGLDPTADHPVAALWPRLVGRGATLARVGRPILLQYQPGQAAPPMPTGLSVASLTDRGNIGGAGIAQRRLTDALVLAGHRVDEHRLSAESPPAAAEWVEVFRRTEDALVQGGYDLVLAGNLHGATRRTTILHRLGRAVPVAAMLHDLFPVTGRCASPDGCPIIAEGCDARCPTPDAYPQLASRRIADIFAEKRAVLAGPDGPVLLAASEWTEAAARALAPRGTAVARIDLAFPTGVFRPQPREALRRTLGLPLDETLVLFAAVIADAPGKGTAELTETFRRIARPGLRFVAVGRLDDPASLGIPNLIAAGSIVDEETLAAWYGACDLYVTASRQETFGQTPVEAGLCGTPTVAYRATGLATAVIDGISGRLVATEPGALEAALLDLLADAPERRRLGTLGRIALESRNSPAAAAMRLNDVLVARGLLQPSTGAGRIRFAPEMLSAFAMALDRAPGRTGLIPSDVSRILRLARRAKHAVVGRDMPRWLRGLLYAAAVTRTRLGWDAR
ncbi:MULTISPECIES: glycosyltransferase [Methylobacterium]|uniref:glycosyltransferase n=1 Tax=Methylobacterium TaxID=407 RepID=UPI0009E9B5A9|nr:glycosyltransferase [Methylobacterium sp. Leaf104]MCI9882123.1 glycosyltransferase [Methylobacterium goesingense]